MTTDPPRDPYRAKRDPARTPEPISEWDVPDEGRDHTGDDQAGRGDTFVVQEHHARALHWDVRLERDGVLVSWAVPKGLPPDPKTNHLARQTEDHPLAYATFAGEIPKGEYGGGTVTIWDAGAYELEKWTDREVKVVLHGRGVQGRYVFFRTRGEAWMVHRMDPPQDPDWQPLPTTMAPMLATTGPLPPEDGRWAYEVKWDGVRVLAFVEGGQIRALARTGRDVTVAYPELREVGVALGSTQALLDGEVVALGPDGRPDFELLQHRMHVTDATVARRAARQVPVTYLVFDLLHLAGHPTLALPYDERRALLERLPGLSVPPSFREDGRAVLRASAAQGLEGIVAKRRGSPYLAGRRSDCWVKVKNLRRQSVVIGGWEPGEGARGNRIGALLVGVQGPNGLRYAGQVGTGFTDETLADLAARLAPLRWDSSPFGGEVPPQHARTAVWVEPLLVAEVEHGSWTHDNRLRHPSYKGLRTDVDPAEVVRE